MAKVNIENLYLSINIGQTYNPVSYPVEFEVEDDFPAEAEENLFDGAYWDDMVAAAADEFNAPDPIEVGDLVEFHMPDDEMDGLIGRVVLENEYGFLVEFFNWHEGHNGGREDDSESRWWCDEDNLTVLER